MNVAIEYRYDEVNIPTCCFIHYGRIVQRYTFLKRGRNVSHVQVAQRLENSIPTTAKQVTETEFIKILNSNGLNTTIQHELKRVKRKLGLKVKVVKIELEKVVEEIVPRVLKQFKAFTKNVGYYQEQFQKLTGEKYDVVMALNAVPLRHLVEDGINTKPIVELLCEQLK